MITKRFQNRVAESRLTLPFVGVYALVMCVLGHLLADDLWVQFCLLVLSSFLMMELNNANALIRIYSRMVSCSFLVLSVMCHFVFRDVQSGIVESCFISFYLLLFSAYQDKSAVGKVFYAFMMLGIASVPFVQILFFVPIVWVLLFTNIMVGSFRTLLSSLMGLVLPYLFWSTYCLLTDKLDMLTEHFSMLSEGWNVMQWSNVSLCELITIVFVVLLAITGMVHFRLSNFKDKIRTRLLFEIFTVMTIINIILMVVQPQYMHYYFAMLIVSTSPMLGHYIALTHTLVTNISFFVIIGVAFLLTICNIWLPF